MKHHISSDMMNCGSPSQSTPLVGFRFHPTDDELLTHFLKPKMLRRIDYQPPIPEVKVCDYEPWDLPALLHTNSDDKVWYFFCPRDYKYLRSRRSNRTTEAGYWKPTGKHRKVLNKRKEQIGTKKSLVFYIKQQPKPIRTSWIMHEYESSPNSTTATSWDFVLCKLKSKADEKISEGKPVDMAFEVDLENQNLNEMTINSSSDEHESNIHMSSHFDDYNPNEKSTSEDKPIGMVLESNIEKQNLNETTVNSSCDEHESSIHISSDFDDYNQSEMTNMSNYEEGEWTSLFGFELDCENQNIDEVITNTSGDEDKSHYYSGNETQKEMAAMSTSGNGKLSDFESQNLYQKTNISASGESEWSPYGPTLSDASNSITSNNNVAEVDPLLSYIDELEFEELAKLIEEDEHNSALYQLPMSPNESNSYSNFSVQGKGSEIGWDNHLLYALGFPT